MKHIYNIPHVPINFRFSIPLPLNMDEGSPQFMVFRRKVASAYLRTSIACRLFNLHYFKIITMEEWVKETQRYTHLFTIHYGREFFR